MWCRGTNSDQDRGNAKDIRVNVNDETFSLRYETKHRTGVGCRWATPREALGWLKFKSKECYITQVLDCINPTPPY